MSEASEQSKVFGYLHIEIQTMLRPLRSNMATLLFVLSLTCAALWVNTRLHIEWYPGKDCDFLRAERGWPFRYLDVYQEFPTRQHKRYIQDGWPRNSGLPWVSSVAKLVADISVAAVIILGLPIAAQFGIRHIARMRQHQATARIDHVARLRWQFTTRTLFAVSLWTVPLWLGVRSSGLIDRLGPTDYIWRVWYFYGCPVACSAIVVSFQLVLARRSHKWCFWRALGTSGLYGVVCFALLWGPLFVRGCGPQPTLWYFFRDRISQPFDIVIHGLVVGTSVGAILSIVVNAFHDLGKNAFSGSDDIAPAPQ